MTQTALEIAAAVRAGEKTAEAVAREALARIALYDAVQPQAWIERFDDAAVLKQAADVDARKAAGERLPLAGVPVAIKDNIDVAGLPTTAACPAFAYRPDRSATVVERLQAAGAVIVGKTNLDQFATGLVGTRSPHGAPACVYNRDYISGGSSSGSAVAVAAGLVPIALGTDTAGSGRTPAAFNGLIGLKPTKGRWSTRGVVAACRSLDCVSVFARTAADAALVDTVLAGFDAEDPYSRRASSQGRPIRGDGRLRVGVPRADQLNLLGDAQSAAMFAQSRERMEGLGASVAEVDIAPLLAAAQLLYAGPWVAERTAALEGLLKTNPGAVHPVVRAIVQAGQGVSAVEAFRGQYALAGYARAAEALWDQIDLLMTPTAATIYRIAEVMAEPVALNANLGLYTNFVNLLDMAAVAVPAGFRDNGTGFGVSFVAPAWSDPGLLDLAARWQAALDLEPPALDLGEHEEEVRVAVVGAHLHGMPLHWQLASRQARLVAKTTTAPTYRLYAMANSTPPKPALVNVGEGGAAIQVEVYALSVAAFGSFTVEVPGPLAIGTVSLADGSSVKGFVAEPRATLGAEDITALGGWRAYIASKA